MHILRQVQEIGAETLARSPKFLLGDDVGLGKTAQLLSAMARINARRVLYVGLGQGTWQVKAEVGWWAPGYSVRLIHGPKRERHHSYANRGDLTILSYETFRNDIDVLCTLPWDLLILDDASHFKNPVSALSLAAQKISALIPWAWAATGTPIETTLVDLWAIYAAINFFPIGDWNQFNARYCVWGYKQAGSRLQREIIEYQNLDDLRERIAPFYLRRINEDSPELVVLDHYMGMHAEQLRLYNLSRNGHFGYNVFERFTRAIMFCDSTVFVEPEAPVSSKIDVLMDLLVQYPGKVVIYSMWKPVLAHLKRRMNQKTIRWVEISGDVIMPVRNDNKRRFTEDPDVKVCLVTKAGEQALNLQAAQLLVCINRIANPQRMSQVHGRIKRAYSPFDKVYVLNLIIRSSLEEYMLALSGRRAQLFEDVFQDASALPTRFTVEEMQLLLERDRYTTPQILS